MTLSQADKMIYDTTWFHVKRDKRPSPVFLFDFFLCLCSYYCACCIRLSTPMDILYSVFKGLESSFPQRTLEDTYLTNPSFPVCKLLTTPTSNWLRGVLSCMRTAFAVRMSSVFLFDFFSR